MFCSNCGSKIEEGSVFCPTCGKKLITEATPSESENSKTNSPKKEKKPINKKTRKIVLFSVIGLMLLVVLIFTTISLFIPLAKLNKAKSLAEKENYIEAHDTLLNISKVGPFYYSLGINQKIDEYIQKAFVKLVEEESFDEAYLLSKKYYIPGVYSEYYISEVYSEELTESTKTLINHYLPEIEFEHAQQLEKEGAFLGAAFLYEDLINKGFYTDYQTHATELKSRANRERSVFYAISDLKKQLKDPNSLVLYSAKTTVIARNSNGKTEYIYQVTLDYGAANSFGGMVRDTYQITYLGASKEEEGILNYHSDILSKTQSDWNDEIVGDFDAYSSSFSDHEDNIWNYDSYFGYNRISDLERFRNS